jgi:exodeoxyribonuclease V alpha subunit
VSETLAGLVDRVTFHNPENGFAVLRVKVKGRRDPVTVVGTLTAVSAGEQLQAAGQWVVDREHGQQFKADRIETSRPASAEGIERYLASGAVRAIGPKLAARIVKIYKQRTLEMFDQYPDVLLHVRGIGQERLKRIRASWQAEREVRKIMVFLAEHQVSPARAVQVYRTYGEQAIQRIKENPYQLADDVRGIGFKTADELAARLGIDRQSPFRASAAVRYALAELSGQGHCGYPEPGVVDHTAELVSIARKAVLAAVERAVAEGAVIRQAVDGQPWLYTAGLYRAEVGVARSLRRLLGARSHPLPPIDVEKAIGWVESRLSLSLAAAQREAVRQACRERVLVITGGPGVGKTTLVRSILEIFAAKGLSCVLGAPTGRAAKRLVETTGRPAKTIHRLLEFDPASGDFLRNERSPLEGDLFVLDETSMVDVLLAHQFLRAVPSAACLILVGDADQLPSVGPGTVLADVIRSGVVPVVRLTEIFRQAGQSRIVAAAHAIHRGQVPEFSPGEGLSEFYFIEADQPEAISDRVVRLVGQRIPARFGVDAKTDVQVLAPMNRGELGVRNLNQVLQQALNPAHGQDQIERFGWTFRTGDRVIQTENDYPRDVFNGDLGVIARIDAVEQEMTVEFDGRPVVYDFADLDELALAYALSIHKSQGSEYPCVVIPLHTQHYLLLQRNLLYTAVTRGKRLVVVVGSRKALSLAVRREDNRRRCTALRRRLQEGKP